MCLLHSYIFVDNPINRHHETWVPRPETFLGEPWNSSLQLHITVRQSVRTLIKFYGNSDDAMAWFRIHNWKSPLVKDPSFFHGGWVWGFNHVQQNVSRRPLTRLSDLWGSSRHLVCMHNVVLHQKWPGSRSQQAFEPNPRNRLQKQIYDLQRCFCRVCRWKRRSVCDIECSYHEQWRKRPLMVNQYRKRSLWGQT